MLSEKTFIEVMDILFEALYIDGELHEMNIDVFLTDYAKLELTRAEKWLFIQQLRKSGLGYQVHTEDGDFKNRLTLSEQALEIIYSHGTYSKYVAEIKAKEEKKRVEDENNKILETKSKKSSNLNNISAVFYGAISIIVTILVSLQQCRESRLNNKVQEQTLKMDSILRAIENLQKQH